MDKAIQNVLCFLLLATMRLVAGETPAEYINRCQSLAREAAASIKDEACDIVVGVCDTPTTFLPPPPPPPPRNPRSLQKKAMMETCRILMRTDCSSEAFNAVFLDYYSECFSLTVYGPEGTESTGPGCEDHSAVLDRFQQEIDSRCNKLDAPEWSPPEVAAS